MSGPTAVGTELPAGSALGVGMGEYEEPEDPTKPVTIGAAVSNSTGPMAALAPPPGSGPPPPPVPVLPAVPTISPPGQRGAIEPSIVEELAGLALREAGAQKDLGRQADLYALLGLLHLDVLEDAATAQRHLASAGPQHPVAPRLRVALAVSSGDAATMAGLEDELARAQAGLSPSSGFLIARDLAEAWLWRFADGTRAAASIQRALRIAPSDPSTRELMSLALAVAGDHAGLVEHLLKPPPAGATTAAGDVPLDCLIEAAHVLSDRMNDPERALDPLQRARGAEFTQPYALERLIELAEVKSAARFAKPGGRPPAPSAGPDLVELYRRKLAVLDPEPSARVERAATSFRLAEHLELGGSSEEARSLYVLLSVAESGTSGFGARLALFARRRLGILGKAWEDAASACRDLSRIAGHAGLGRAYLRRAAELADARVTDGELATELYAELFQGDAGDPGTMRALARLHLTRSKNRELVGLLEAFGQARGDLRPAAYRAAAAVAESRLSDLEAAAGLRRASMQGDADVAGLEDLARMARRSRDRNRLAEAYKKLARMVDDDRTAGFWHVAAGLQALVSTGIGRDAEESFGAALKKDPANVFAHAALAAQQRRAQRWADLAGNLRDMAPLLADDATRAMVLRELGRVTASKLGDPRAARAHLERGLELSPNDTGLLAALADLLGDTGDWTRGIELRERAVTLSDDPARASRLLFEIGEIQERQLKNDDAARDAYERALQRDVRSLDALRALQGQYRKAKRLGDLLGVLRREVDLLSAGHMAGQSQGTTRDAGTTTRLVTLQLEIARYADQLEGDSAAVLVAFRGALELDPANTTALLGLERLCRRDGRWEELAEAMRRAPRTQRNVHTLGEALEKLERWSDLGEVRRVELELLEDAREAAKVARGLAALYEDRLGDGEAAGRFYRRATELDPTERASHNALTKHLESRGKWGELAEAIERELLALSTAEPAHRIELLMRLGEIRREKLDRAVEAAHAFEGVLQIDPAHMPALVALTDLYTRLSREPELLRILEATAAATVDKTARADVWQRVGELRDRRNEVDQAIAALRNAFELSPSNRALFTALERLCYKRERWLDAMHLYDAAIALVETRAARAYRLGDLYARRGQIQLQYLGQPGEAAASYLRVIELDPDNDTAVKFLESIFSQQSDWVGLIRAYEKRADLIADDERKLETLRRAARVAAAKLKDAAEAARFYSRIVEVEPGDSEALDALERFYERQRDWEALVRILTTRLALAPAGDAAVTLYARIATICEEGLRDENRAVDHYRKILEISPGHKEALDALARIYESTEKWVEFIDVTRRQIRVTNDRNVKALLYFKCGSVMESKFGKEEDAIRYYDAAIKTSPSCLPAVHGMRDLYLRKQDWARVIQSLELEVKLWQEDKERAGVFAQIGQIYGDKLGDAARALHYFESALAVDPDCLPANKALFELHFSRQEWGQAAPLGAALSQKAMREGEPSERSAFYTKRGIVAMRTSDPRGAAESLVIALEIKPDNLGALEELRRLAQQQPDAYDFNATFRELEKIYRRRDAGAALARVLGAQADLAERAGELDNAMRLHEEAERLAPDDPEILDALVDLHIRLRRYGDAARDLEKYLERRPPEAQRIRGLFRLAEIFGDGMMDPARAVNSLREVLRLQPTHREAHYQLAQELYLIGRHQEAQKTIEKLIDLAAQPGETAPPEALARYYYYLGRVIEAQGNLQQAASRYRRAVELDPAYAPPALALARKAADAGDRRSAESHLITAAHAAMERGGPREAVPLQRGLARILLAAGDRAAAIEAYRGILAVEPESLEDRVALAEIYAGTDLERAIAEVGRVLTTDLRHAPAFRLLGQLYERAGDRERAMRVLAVLDLLGYSEGDEKTALNRARSARQQMRRGVVSEETRRQALLPPALRSPIMEAYAMVRHELIDGLPPPNLGEHPAPIGTLPDIDMAARADVSEMMKMMAVDCEVIVADKVPGLLIVTEIPRPTVAIDRTLLMRPDPSERRFVLGRAFEIVRGGYAPLLRFATRERMEAWELLKALLLPESDRPASANEFVHNLPRKTAKALERLVGMPAGVEPDELFHALMLSANRAGMLACDDIAAACRALARLANEDLAVDPNGAVALGAVVGGLELVRYYLAEDYSRLRMAMANQDDPGGHGPGHGGMPPPPPMSQGSYR